MSGGEQQMLAVARALLGNPTLLLLDEPSMGLAPVLVDLIFETIERIRDQGVTVLVVEQNALAALEIADYAYVLESDASPCRARPRSCSTTRRSQAAYPRPLGLQSVTVEARSITPLEKANLRERVLQALRAAIISGELTPGEVYSAPSLAATGVSATPYARRCSTSPRRTWSSWSRTRASGDGEGRGAA